MFMQPIPKQTQEILDKEKRFVVLVGSESAHCCFDATIVDTQTLDSLGNPSNIAECFDMNDALRIAEALNEKESK